jgi:anti-sigma factor RsiW
MNTIEEKLWNYIDGTCSPVEKEAVARLIEQDEAYAQKYQELLALNQEFAKMELDEPPMAFTYNVMEAIRTENAMQPLKAKIDKRIILGITIFFAFTILALLVFVFANINIAGLNVNAADIKLPAGVKLPSASSMFSGPLLKWFLVFDVVLALFLTDAYLRRKKTARQL